MHNSPWLTWRSLNRLPTGYTCSKEQLKKWKYYDGDTCVCGLATENTAHLLQCSLLTRPCTLDDFLDFNDTGRECAEIFFLQGRFYLKNRQKPTATLIYTDNIIYNIYTTYIPPPPIINTFSDVKIH